MDYNTRLSFMPNLIDFEVMKFYERLNRTEQNRTEQNFIHVDKHVRSLTGDIRYI